MRLFNSGPSPHQTAVAMVGAKPGDAVLCIGCEDPDLIAEIAHGTGLNGRSVAVDSDPAAAARIDEAARRAGALVDFVLAPPFAQFPDVGANFDVVIVRRPLAVLSASDRAATAALASRLVRPGGRIMLVQGTRQSGFLFSRTARQPVIPASEASALLLGIGALAVRTLATSQGVIYVEARTARPN
jgi:SAM-dependent methyltransferase